MPPRRNKNASTAIPRAAQSTLSFNNKATRVTKPSTQPPTIDKKPTTKLNKAVQDEIIEELSKPVPATKDIEHEQETVAELKVSNEDEDSTSLPTKSTPKKKSRISTSSLTSDDLDIALSSAKSIPETRIRKYWKAEEDSRLAPRVHQSTLPLQEKILRHFDLSSQYGPCIGIPRLNRWKRAYTLNLNPPIEVLAVLMKEEAKGAKKRETGVIAYVDALGGGRMGIVE